MTNQHATTTDYLAIRSILETPILDDHKWAKLPNIGADMVFIDLEDSVPPHRKDEARDKACEWLGRLDWFGDKAILARPNHLDTPWGEADVKALAEAGVTCMAYPKITNRGDLDRVIGLLSQHGASPDIFAIIEMAGAVLEMKEIATTPGVVALMSGPGDLSVDAGMELFEPDGELNPVFLMMKTQTVLTGVVYGLATTDIAYRAGPARPDRGAPPRRGIPSDGLHRDEHVLSTPRRHHQRRPVGHSRTGREGRSHRGGVRGGARAR